MYPTQRQTPQGQEYQPSQHSQRHSTSPMQTPAMAQYTGTTSRPIPAAPGASSHMHGISTRSQPASPELNRSVNSRERSSTAYYDPKNDAYHDPAEPNWSPTAPYRATYFGARQDPATGYRDMVSPRGPPGPRGELPPIVQQSPIPPYPNGNESVAGHAYRKPSLPPPSRSSNPMSMSNLLSDDAPPAVSTVTSPRQPAQVAEVRRIDPPPPAQVNAEITPVPSAPTVSESPKVVPQVSPPSEMQRRLSEPNSAQVKPPPVARPPHASSPPSGPPDLTVRGTEAAYAAIEARELSDVENDGEFAALKEDWQQRSQKRKLEIEYKEAMKRKRRRTAMISKYADMFAISADAAKTCYVVAHEKDAEDQVRNKDIEEEKERKKDMQRKRRRERTLQNETAKRDEAMQRLQHLQDEEERQKIIKDVRKAGKKIRNTEDLLQGKTPSKEVEEEESAPEEPPAPKVVEPVEPKPRRGVKTRPRKSKEQKLAEKENAAAAQAALDRGDDLPAAEPVEEPPPVKPEPKAPKQKPPPAEVVPYSSKGYNQIYEQIWKDLAKNHVNKVYRIRNTSIDTKQSNLRKTAQLASKEARRWQIKTNKSTKDVQARAKRSMREMLSFWKRNERDERDQRKMAEKQELENARKAEADREAARQKRKLNFLISQTELYSHFIGKKVKTDELEKAGNDVTVSAQTTREGPSNAHTIDLPASNANLAAKVTNFEDLDFDAEDESALQAAAMANAQNAIKEAQDRARAFNNDNQPDDDGEMNFQNPTSLQNMDVEQPKMLTCKLKEYQLKGLNWLVNLYEQGINGILADEMGLGKTVQSISVMSYLAEVHNIWGPFLVIAPASTLHNWQQEIAKFVPNLKVLPYWGNAKDRKVLRKFWDRKHITYTKDSPFHVLVTSYQLVVVDTPYFQKIRWQYMILDEAQAIKSSQSSRWKALLGFHCRNRLLLTGTPIQNNMQELWALLHFIMPSLFDSHDEFSDWFSKDIESHAQSNTKLNEDQLKRLHMILKPFMLRRVKKHVQKELGDKIEEDVFCDMTYRQRAYYTSLRNKISFMDLLEKAAIGDDQDTASLMNLVMQFRKVCNHPDLFERADITSPFSLSTWAETASFMREGFNVHVPYSVKSPVEYWIPKRLISGDGRLDLAGPDNPQVGWRQKHLAHLMSVWDAENIRAGSTGSGTFSWLRFIDASAGELAKLSKTSLADRIVDLERQHRNATLSPELRDEGEKTYVPGHSLLNIVKPHRREPLAEVASDGHLQNLFNISRISAEDTGFNVIETCVVPKVSAPPVELICPDQESSVEKETAFFNVPLRRALYPISTNTEMALLKSNIPRSFYPVTGLLPPPESEKQRYTKIQVPSMSRFVSDCGKLAKLDELLKQLKAGGHRVLLYFQMTRMIDMMEEYLTYRNYRYCRLDGSTKLEDRRDTVAAFQASNEIFVFLLSTRAGGLGINLVAADTVIFYDSDWNPTIDSQAMDRAHRLGQTRQVTVYRLITRGTIEERIRKRALQKEEVQRVVISGGTAAGSSSTGVDFTSRPGNNRTKDIAMWLADDDQAAEIEKKEAEMLEAEAKDPSKKRRREKGGAAKKKEVSMDDMYHEGEGKFDDDNSNKPSGAATPVVDDGGPPPKRKKISKKAKTMQQRLAVADGQA